MKKSSIPKVGDSTTAYAIYSEEHGVWINPNSACNITKSYPKIWHNIVDLAKHLYLHLPWYNRTVDVEKEMEAAIQDQHLYLDSELIVYKMEIVNKIPMREFLVEYKLKGKDESYAK